MCRLSAARLNLRLYGRTCARRLCMQMFSSEAYSKVSQNATHACHAPNGVPLRLLNHVKVFLFVAATKNIDQQTASVAKGR